MQKNHALTLLLLTLCFKTLQVQAADEQEGTLSRFSISKTGMPDIKNDIGISDIPEIALQIPEIKPSKEQYSYTVERKTPQAEKVLLLKEWGAEKLAGHTALSLKDDGSAKKDSSTGLAEEQTSEKQIPKTPQTAALETMIINNIVEGYVNKMRGKLEIGVAKDLENIRSTLNSADTPVLPLDDDLKKTKKTPISTEFLTELNPMPEAPPSEDKKKYVPSSNKNANHNAENILQEYKSALENVPE